MLSVIFKFLAVVILAPLALKIVDVSGLITIMIIAGICYWLFRTKRGHKSQGVLSKSKRTRMARRAVNRGELDKNAACVNFDVTNKDIKKQRYVDELFW
ncbi:hypothetical protein [Janthinobacterium sp. MDT1-19]|uniref:hypothetical protein n=1 Tax=Janthinobacterium sp. MDT1-19 TaxID=1259339 RepID=UPI003F1E672A